MQSGGDNQGNTVNSGLKLHVDDWKELFLQAMAGQQVDGMVGALRSQATPHAGTAPAKIKQGAVKMLQRGYRNDPEALYKLALGFCGSDDATALEVGAVLVADFYEGYPAEVETVLRSVATHDNWEVREWAASACGLALEHHFEPFHSALKVWAQSDDEKLRRAVVLAAMYAGRSRNPMFVGPLLNLLEPLLADTSKYVGDNLGPFALGSALIDYYPAQVLERLRRWVTSEDARVRWNVAMVFSAAKGAKYARDASPVLEVLMRDNRTEVQRAVTKALRRIAKDDSGFADTLSQLRA